MQDKNIFNIIDGLSVSSGWKKVFKKIQVAYYHNFYQGKANNVHFWAYGQEVANLSPTDRFRYFTRFNFFAFLFGPLYYFAKLMLIKGIILLAIEAGIIYHWGLPIGYLAVFVHLYCAIFANSDYFRAKVLNNREVKENPTIISDFVDTSFTDKINKEPSFYGAFFLFCVVFFGAIAWFIYGAFEKDIKYQNILTNHQKVCNSKQACTQLLNTSMTNIKTKKEPLHREYFNLGAAYYELGNRQAALSALNQSVALNKEIPFPYLLQGVIYMELRQYNQARQNFETALKIYPNGKMIYYYLGSIYYKEGKFKEAEAAFLKAVKAYPSNATYREALAYTRINLRDKENAKADLEKTIRLLKKEEKKNGAKIEALEAYKKRLK